MTMIRGAHHTSFTVANLEQSLSFFRDLLGLEALGTREIGDAYFGRIVGLYFDSTGAFHGFLENAGSFIAIDYPGSRFTQANGINNSDDIVGTYTDAIGTEHGFLAVPTPEPNTLVLLGLCLSCLTVVWRQRNCGKAPAIKQS